MVYRIWFSQIRTHKDSWDFRDTLCEYEQLRTLITNNFPFNQRKKFLLERVIQTENFKYLNLVVFSNWKWNFRQEIIWEQN